MSGGMLFTSGQIAINPKTGEIFGNNISEQTEMVMKNLGAILENAGIAYDNVINTTCFLKNMEDFAAFNEIYGRYFLDGWRDAESGRDLSSGDE